MNRYDEIPDPASDEYKTLLEQSVRQKLLDDAVETEYARVSYGDRSSPWLPVDLQEFVSGSAVEIEPKWRTAGGGGGPR